MCTCCKAYFLLIGFFFFPLFYVSGQNQQVADSLRSIYEKNTQNDKAKLTLLRELAFNEVRDLKLALKYAEELIQLSIKEQNYNSLHSGYLQKGNKKRLLGNLDEALDAYIKSAEAAKKAGYSTGQGTAYMAIADLYSISDNYANAMNYYAKAINILRQSDNKVLLASALLNAGEAFRTHKNYASALRYFKESGKIFEEANYRIGKAYNLGNIGMVYASTGKNTLAEQYINEAIQHLQELKVFYPISVYLLSMADIYLEKGDKPNALSYAQRSLTIAQQFGLKQQIGEANLKLSEIHEKTGDARQSLGFYKSYVVYRDSVNNLKAVQKMADLRTDYEVSQKQIEVDLLNQEKSKQRIILISLLIILCLTIGSAAILFRYTNLLKRQKKEINHKSLQLEQSLSQLRTTQKQLIQKEKMASLGELTAGIAHEIQNPLNFVNNFAEVSTELLEDVRQEEERPDRDAAYIAELLDDLKLNLQRISEHGGCASAIIKGMLEHSRVSTGELSPTDLNALASEYLKIAYQGQLAKDKSFHAALITQWDNTLTKVEMMPQEIGRVLLNLYSNAFYAVQQQLKVAPDDYQPTVTVCTVQQKEHIEIRVSDNGTGIPDSIREKIFQPFLQPSQPEKVRASVYR